MKRKRTRALGILLAGAVMVLAPAPAQAHTLLSELLLKMLLSDIVLAPPTGPFSSHEAHFQPILTSGEVASGFQVNQLEVPLAINSIIAAQLATIPLGRFSTPLDVANACLYLASDEASFISGVCIEVDGARSV